ncbi:MAG: glycosyltransferase family 4 protein [Thermodesulfobacteriota bacterium]
MRIGFDAKRYFLNRTGLGNYARNTLNSLEKFHPENEYILYTPQISKGVASPASRTKICRPRKNGKAGSAFWRTFRLGPKIRKDRLDVFHGLSHELPLGINKAGCASVVTMHDLIFMKLPHLYPVTDSLIYRVKYKASCNAADMVIAISESTKKDLIKYFGISEDKIRVVYQSCAPEFFKICPENIFRNTSRRYGLPDKFLLYVGSLARRKNVRKLVQAVCRLDANELLPLVLVGQGHKKYVHSIFKTAAEHGLEDKILHLKNVSNADLPALYQAAEIFIYPSLYEGFGIPVLEALASGTPVITSDNSCLREAGGPGSLYVNPASPDQIRDAVLKIMEDNKLREKMVEQGLSHAHGFKPEKTAENLIRVYREIL